MRAPWMILSLALFVLTVSAGVGLPSLWARLHFFWTQVYGPFAHGYLVLVMALILAHRFWRIAPVRALMPRWSAAPVFLLIVCALVLMESLGLSASRLVLVPPLVLTAIWWVFGRDCAMRLLWPVGFVYFALPPWGLLDRPLQWLTVQIVNQAVGVTGIPAFVQGNFFLLPSGTFEIALGCSGLNYLITALSLFSYYGLMYIDSWNKRVHLLAVAVTVAILSNWIRVFALIVVGYATDMRHYLIQVEHHYFGWVLFAVLMWPVLMLARSLEPVGHSDTLPTAAIPVVSASVLAAASLAAAGLIVAGLLTGRLPVSPLPGRASGHETAVTEALQRPCRVICSPSAVTLRDVPLRSALQAGMLIPLLTPAG